MKKFLFSFLSIFVLFFSACSVMIDDFSALKTSVNYSVLTYYESLETEGDYVQSSGSKSLSGLPGKTTDVVAEETEGFTALPVEQKTILADGSTLVKVYYKRNTVTLNFYASPKGISVAKWTVTNDGTSEEVDSLAITGRYGASLTEENKASLASSNLKYTEGSKWTFGGWNEKNGSLPSTFPASDTSYYAQWLGIFYTVNYHFEDLDGTSYSESESYPAEMADTFNDSSSVKAGDTLNSENFTAKEIAGFTAKEINPVTITDDGKTVVDLYYNRNTYSVTFNLNGGQRADGTTDAIVVSGKYGAAIDVPEVDTDFNHKADIAKFTWRFNGWAEDNTSTSTVSLGTFAENKVLYASWTKTHAVYTVRYLFEDVDSSDYQADSSYPDVTEAKTEIGKTTAVTAASVTGFNEPSIAQVSVSADASSVVLVKYARKTITLTFNAEDGSWSDGKTKTVSGKYGASVSLPENPTLTDKTFIAWCLAGTSTRSTPSTFPAEDTSYSAYYASSAAYYTIEHYFEKTDSSGYEIDSSKTTKERVGYDPDSSEAIKSNATALDVEGFTAQNFDQIEVNKDGSSTLKIYYNRNTVTLTFKAGDGSWSDGETKTVSGKYGTTLTAPENPSKDEYYEFDTWSPALPSTIPSAAATYTAIYKQVKADYTVQVRYEKLDGSYEVQSSTSKMGTIGDTTSETAADDVTGYSLQLITQQKITSDGKTVVNVNYNRKTITYTFEAAGGAWSDSSLGTLTGKYGASVTSPDTSKLTRSGWTFNGWSQAIPKTFTAENMTFTAKWLPNQTSSTEFAASSDVELKSSLSDDTYTFSATEVTGASYAWYVDGALKSDFTSSNASMTKAELSSGVHTILVVVTDNGLTFTKSLSVTVD